MATWTQAAQESYWREKAQREEGAARLALPENRWALEVFDQYLDIKDHARGTRLEDLTPAMQTAFRAIRQGSGGRLGNPPSL